jgi:hypothetical protein
MPSGEWVFDPDSGGVKISAAVKRRTESRIRAYAEANFAGKYTRLDIRFRGQFCYIDAYTEPFMRDGWPPGDWPETREAYQKRLRNTPTHLCRLRHFDEERWGFAFYSYSNEKYSLSVYENGEFFGIPEEAFQAAANAYLNE